MRGAPEDGAPPLRAPPEDGDEHVGRRRFVCEATSCSVEVVQRGRRMQHLLYLVRVPEGQHEGRLGIDAEVVHLEFWSGSTLLAGHQSHVASPPPWVNDPALGALGYCLDLACWSSMVRSDDHAVDDQADFLRALWQTNSESIWHVVRRISLQRIKGGWHRFLTGIDLHWVTEADWKIVRVRHAEGEPVDQRVLW